MRTISHPLFIIVLLVYLTYYVLKHTGVQMPEFVTSYLADLLSLFLINTSVLYLLRKIYKKSELELPLGFVIVSFILITLVFEVIQPIINNYFIADPIDIVCYLISASSYYLWRMSRALN